MGERRLEQLSAQTFTKRNISWPQCPDGGNEHTLARLFRAELNCDKTTRIIMIRKCKDDAFEGKLR